MSLPTENCDACHGDGYFGDYMPSLYPMPCQYCVGSGKKGVCTPELHKRVDSLRKEGYIRIEEKLPKPSIAGQIFKATIMMGLTKTAQERLSWQQRHSELSARYATEFPKDYIDVEREALRSTWEQVYGMVDTSYKPLVEERMNRVLERKTLIELIDLELLDVAIHPQ